MTKNPNDKQVKGHHYKLEKSFSFVLKWIECYKCKKWRSIPGCILENNVMNPFICHYNFWNMENTSCHSPQEQYNLLIAQQILEKEENYLMSVENCYLKRSKKKQEKKTNKNIPEENKTKNCFSVIQRFKCSTKEVLTLPDNKKYMKNRRIFYRLLENYLGRPPMVNILNGLPLDLYKLYNEVINRGGYRKVCVMKLWREIFRTYPQYTDSHTSASYELKKIYRENLLEYEIKQNRIIKIIS